MQTDIELLVIIGVAALLTAGGAILADWNERKPPIFFLLKPLTTVLIALMVVLAPATIYRDLLLVGLGLSMVGDICLMFDGPRAFLGGLGSFLVAHGVFIAAFVHGLPLVWPPWWTLGYVVIAGGFSVLLLPRAGALKLPVLVYGLALLGMALTAAMRYAELRTVGAGLAQVGASLFLVSDLALGIRTFVGPYRGAQGIILSGYWAAIGLIALSAWW